MYPNSRAGSTPCACCSLKSFLLCSHTPGHCAARTLLRSLQSQEQRSQLTGMLSTSLSLMQLQSGGRWKGWRKQGQCSRSRSRGAALWLCSWREDQASLPEQQSAQDPEHSARQEGSLPAMPTLSNLYHRCCSEHCTQKFIHFKRERPRTSAFC